jgi:hypothetical protein
MLSASVDMVISAMSVKSRLWIRLLSAVVHVLWILMIGLDGLKLSIAEDSGQRGVGCRPRARSSRCDMYPCAFTRA